MNKFVRGFILIAALIFITSLSALASTPPPPPPPPGGGEDPIPIGGTAAIGSGIVLLVSMAAAYGAKKIYDARRRLEE